MTSGRSSLKAAFFFSQRRPLNTYYLWLVLGWAWSSHRSLSTSVIPFIWRGYSCSTDQTPVATMCSSRGNKMCCVRTIVCFSSPSNSTDGQQVPQHNPPMVEVTPPDSYPEGNGVMEEQSEGDGRPLFHKNTPDRIRAHAWRVKPHFLSLFIDRGKRDLCSASPDKEWRWGLTADST